MSVEELPLAPTLTDAESVVIAGPPMSGKYELMHRLFGAAGDRAIVLSTGHDAERVRTDYTETTGHDPDSIGIVDCVTREQGKSVEDTDLKSTPLRRRTSPNSASSSLSWPRSSSCIRRQPSAFTRFLNC